MKRFKWKELVVGLTLGGLLFSPWGSLLGADPYSDVDVVLVSPEGDGVVITANFRKNECVFSRLEVFGYVFDELQILTWENVVVGSEEDYGPNYDRTNGGQTLRIRVKTNGVDYDKLEIRTRHDCNGKTVDKVFATIRIGALNGQ